VHTSPQVYLIPSQQGACMFNATGVQNFCATASQIENGEAVEAALCAPGLSTDEIELGGILPDGVYNASVTLSDGSAVPLAVEGDTYVADFPRTGPLPTELAWDTADGQRHVASADVPGSAASEDCVAPSS
jgi:hypothetical protein